MIEAKSPDVPVSEAPPSPQLLAQRDAWVRRLMDFSRRNRLIYYRELKRGTLQLSSDLSHDPVARLAAGETRTLADFFGDGLTTAENAKAKEIRSVAKSNEEERGLQTLFVALGFANWKASDDGSPANAPIFLMPVSIAANERTGQISLKRSGDLIINRVMLAKLEDEYNIKVNTSFFDEEEARDNIQGLYNRIATVELAAVPGFAPSPKCVLGNFDYQKMAMVEDLRSNEAMLAEHELVAAIAGDEQARAQIAASQRSIDARELDSIPPRDEPFVLGADGSQQVVLHSAIRHPTHRVIIGPPGTGKSQTISNMIAAFIARGKSVLFVAEKRAALEVVYKRLDQVGLGHLVLDLHGGDVKRKTIYERLLRSDEVARKTTVVDGAEEERRFEELRTALNSYDAALHRKQDPFKLSAFEVFSRLAALGDVEARTRWRGKAIEEFTEERAADARAQIVVLSAHPELAKRVPGVPWSTATFNVDGATAALTALGELQQSLAALRNEFSAISPPLASSPRSLVELRETIPNVEALSSAIAIFGGGLFALDLEDFDAALASARGNVFQRIFAYLNRPFREHLRQLHSLSGTRWPGAASAARSIHNLAALPAAWRGEALAGRFESFDAAKLLTAARTVIEKNRELSKTLLVELPGALEGLADELDKLDRNSRNASIVPGLRVAESQLRKHLDCDALVDEMFTAGVEAASWRRLFQKAWLSSVLDTIVGRETVLASFKASAHDDVVEHFRGLDQRRMELMARRICRSAAERYIWAMNEYPQQRATVRLELQKKIKHMPFRKLMLNAPNVLSAICPCFMASPLSVSQLLPAQELFDVVIFDEGSQVLPEDAVPAIIRGKHTVVAGDPRQLPPTTFFASSETDDEEEEENSLATSGIESILDLLTPFVEPRALTWHYRSNDERLIAFSNTHIYADRLLTLPGTGKDGAAVVHEYVPPQLVDGQESSAPAEATRVVELILQHAETHPEESLGVIAMGIRHARRIEEGLSNARASRPELDEFFSEDRDDRFFVKNLERVQGDERDAIILSIGYGPDRSGKMVYRFGPINQLGGERRLNVAITRARNRMTVVSSFRRNDLDPERLRSQGAKLIGAFIGYAETRGANLGREGSDTSIELNDFEQDIMDALTRHGLQMVPQYGVSQYRIDLAVKHPDEPGRFVLAIECDGAAYHSAPTARNRDRLRQQHLEALGWRFHRIWSTEWFYHRDEEITRAVARYEQSLNGDEEERNATRRDLATPSPPVGVGKRSRPRPAVRRRLPIDEYQVWDLHKLIAWIESDGLLRTDDELLDEIAKELDYSRKGHRIVQRLQLVIANYRRKNKVTPTGRSSTDHGRRV
ncbi:MAG: AAA domain-containing protein [Candidatus Cybelea sp.]